MKKFPICWSRSDGTSVCLLKSIYVWMKECFEAKFFFFRVFKYVYLNFLVCIINLENFQNEGNLCGILSKLNLRNFKWHLKIKDLKFFRPIYISKFSNWHLNILENYKFNPYFFQNYKLTPYFFQKLQIGPEKSQNEILYYSIQTLNFKNEGNLKRII
jgi:hypothetical protein